MKKMLMRPAAALFPLVGLICALIGDAELVSSLFLFYFALQLLTLCSADAFRNAASREPGVRKVDRRFCGALPTVLLGAALTWLLTVKLFLPDEDMMSWIAVFGAAVMIIIEQLFEERMYALSRRTDGVVLSVISNVLLSAGLLLDTGGGMEGPVHGFYTGCGAGLGALIAGVSCYIVEPAHGFSLIPRNIGFFPKACVQTLLYPALCIGLARFAGIPSALAGLALWRLSRTVCRRAGDESRSLNLVLAAAAAVLIAASQWIPIAFGFMALIALICAALVFCAPGWRLYAGIALLIAAEAIVIMKLLPYYAAIALCAAAIIVNLKRAFLRKV